MPKLVLKYEDRILKEVPVTSSPVTIGRVPGNTIAIDNPAVSSQHARVMVEGGQYVVEDLGSTNGTFVKEQAIKKHILQEGDVIRVGKHTLTFYGIGKGEAVEEAPAAAAPAAQVQALGGTVFLDTKSQKELLAKVKAAAAAGQAGAEGQATPAAAPKAAVAAAAAKPGLLTVVSGRTDQRQYTLEAQTTLVGKSQSAMIRLKGWFKPDVAAAITKKGAGYLVTPLKGKTLVNGQPLKQGYELKVGDVLSVSGVTMQFSQRE
ncbi:MAG: FHA domain-containing protein [Candidatus Acidiferrales bacterium]